eukprot:jgi/Botrbrau1/5860/Bobra.0366s0041.2
MCIVYNGKRSFLFLLIHLFWIGCILSQESAPRPAPSRPDIWIILPTSAPEPTIGIKHLASLTAWQLLLIPLLEPQQTWPLPRVEYLDNLKVDGMKCSVAALLPRGSEGLRMLGHLFAYAHGAKFTLDATDDTRPVQGSEIPILPLPAVVNMYVPPVGAHLMNVHHYFGSPRTWPAGYPVELLGEPQSRFVRRAGVRPFIQHGLSDTVGAEGAWELLTGTSRWLGNLVPTGGPLALPRGVFCPFGAQRVVFSREATWASFVPQSLSPRTALLVRSLMAQALLWEVGGHTTFLPPPEPSMRTFSLLNRLKKGADPVKGEEVHVNITEVQDELSWQSRLPALVQLLHGLRLPGTRLPDRLRALAAVLRKHQWLDDSDVKLMEAWIADLDKYMYKWPSLQDSASEALPTKDGAAGQSDGLFPQQFHRFPEIIAVVTYKGPTDIARIRLLNAMYRSIFGKVVHTGYLASAVHSRQELATFIFEDCPGSAPNQPHFLQECWGRVMHRYEAPLEGGYLFFEADTLINPCRLPAFPLAQIWAVEPALVAYKAEGHGETAGGTVDTNDGHGTVDVSLLAAAEALRDTCQMLNFNATTLFQLGQGPEGALARYWSPIPAHLFYIPVRLVADFLALSFHFAREGVPAEVALAQMVGILSRAEGVEVVPVRGVHLKEEAAANRKEWQLSGQGLQSTQDYVQGVKPSADWREVVQWWTGIKCSQASASASIS